MRYREIVRRPATTDAHPFTTDITIHPIAFDDFERAMEDRHDVRLLARIDGPNSWLVHVGCSSESVRRTIQATGADRRRDRGLDGRLDDPMGVWWDMIRDLNRIGLCQMVAGAISELGGSLPTTLVLIV